MQIMKQFLPTLLLIVTVISCNKEDMISPKDYTAFLKKTQQTFGGNLNGKDFYWRFALDGCQGLAGFQNGNGICDSTDPERVVLFGLNSTDGQNGFTLYSPKFNSASDIEILHLFSPGIKQLGDLNKDFHLSMRINGQLYSSGRLNAVGEIEILKSEEFTDYLGKKIRVWFRLDGRMASCNCNNNSVILKDGLMIAEFWGYKKG